MKISGYIIIGENIHCTRILKRDGKLVTTLPDGSSAILYDLNGQKKQLPIPELFLKSADWENGKVKHCCVAIWQGIHGTGTGQQAGIEYLQNMAHKQERHGATYLDINVDEFSTDMAERTKAMQWAVKLIQNSCSLPLSIDSSNMDCMLAGLLACDPKHGRPVLNSISLERIGLLDAAAKNKTAVVASAAGEKELPTNAEERMHNLSLLIEKLTASGIQLSWIHADPLVYTISTDVNNGRMFLDTVNALRKKYGPALHILGGLSNVSFGMPCRKLINLVFAYLTQEAGGDGGIVDPMQINAKILEALDVQSESFHMAKALLLGEDEFGINFIAAHRQGKIK